MSDKEVESDTWDWLFKEGWPNVSHQDQELGKRLMASKFAATLMGHNFEFQVKSFLGAFFNDEDPKQDSALVSLFLRPFRVDSAFDYSTKASKGNLEQLIAKVVKPGAMLYGLGATNLAKSKSVIPTLSYENETWQTEVRKAIQIAVPIFLVPGTEPAVSWEVQEIIDADALAKTIFVMPATLRSNVIDAERHWAVSSWVFKNKFGIDLPEYSFRGAWFSLGADRSVSRITPDVGLVMILAQSKFEELYPKESFDVRTVGPILRALLLEDFESKAVFKGAEWSEITKKDEVELRQVVKTRDAQSTEVSQAAIQFGILAGKFSPDMLNTMSAVQRETASEYLSSEFEKIRSFLTDDQIAILARQYRDSLKPQPEPKIPTEEFPTWTIGLLLLLIFIAALG